MKENKWLLLADDHHHNNNQNDTDANNKRHRHHHQSAKKRQTDNEFTQTKRPADDHQVVVDGDSDVVEALARKLEQLEVYKRQCHQEIKRSGQKEDAVKRGKEDEKKDVGEEGANKASWRAFLTRQLQQQRHRKQQHSPESQQVRRRQHSSETQNEPFEAAETKRQELRIGSNLETEATQSEIKVVGHSDEEVEQSDRLHATEMGKRLRQKQQEGQQVGSKHKRAPKLRKAKRDDKQVNLSFCGCGFLGIYHVGVASCFHEYAPQLSMEKISGSSAGALVAVSHICGNLQLAYATTDILRVAIDARARTLGPFHPAFDITAMVREALEKGLPDDVHLQANGKLHVSLTRVYDGENVIISEFQSKEEVIQVLLCSCFIPIWSGLKAPKFRGVTYIDGGFSNNLLILDDKTVTVSPFAGEADICPQDDTLNLLQVSLSNTSFSLTPDNLYRLSHALLPPPPEVLSSLCEQGFADGIRFLQRMKLISCTKCLEIRSSLLVTTNGEDMEEAVKQEVSAEEFYGDGLAMGSSGAGVSSSEQHIRLEHQEQKMIEINDGNRRRDSVVSTTSQVYQQQQQNNLCNILNGYDGGSEAASSGNQFAAATNTTTLISSTSRADELSEILQVSDDTGEEPADYFPPHHTTCHECVRIRQRALSDRNLPKQFSDRIRDACDTVNKSLSYWIYSHRPIKYLSYLAAPYYLPFEISLALIARFWHKLPQIRSEISDCFSAIVDFLAEILRRMHAKSVGGSAANGLLAIAPCSITAGLWSEDEAAAEALVINRQREANKLAQNAAKRRRISHHSQTSGSHNAAKNQPSTGNLSSSLNDVSAAAVAGDGSVGDSISLKITSDGLCVSKVRPQSASLTSSINGAGLAPDCNFGTGSLNVISHAGSHPHSLEDTFDSIVDVTSNQEARIFAYYFRDAKNRLQVTEIFDLQRAAELAANSQTAAGGKASKLSNAAKANNRSS